MESDIDPITMASDKLSAFVHQSAVGPADVSPAIFSAMDADISGLNKDMTACMRILGANPHLLQHQNRSTGNMSALGYDLLVSCF